MIRLLNTGDLDEFFQLRLAGLESDPQSFSANSEDWRNTPQDEIESMLTKGGVTGNMPIWGEFQPSLVGLVGFRRETRPSLRHKATVWGLYVEPNHRGGGIGKALMTELLEHAHSLPALELIRLTVTSTDTPAIALFEQLGFETYGLEKRARLVEGTYFDQTYMSKYLPRP